MYKEPRDPLTLKSNRHSKSAAISQAMGIGKSIIKEESKYPELKSTGAIVYQNKHQKLIVYDSDVVRAYLEEISFEDNWDRIADNILISKGFGTKVSKLYPNLGKTPMSVIGSTAYSNMVYSIMNYFEQIKNKEKDVIVFKNLNTWNDTKKMFVDLIVTERDVFRAIRILKIPFEQYSWKTPADDVGEEILKSKGFGDNRISPLTALAGNADKHLYVHVLFAIGDYMTKMKKEGIVVPSNR